MKVMICHSGALSVAVGHALRKALRQLFPYGEPFMSDEDIEPGTLWHERLSGVLYGTSAALICLTRSNVGAPWLHYEAGAVATTLRDNTRVVPILIDVLQSDVKGPMMHFQAVPLKKEHLLKLVHTLNELAEPHKRLPREWLGDLFERIWSSLHEELQRAGETYGSGEHETLTKEEEMYLRILDLLQNRLPSPTATILATPSQPAYGLTGQPPTNYASPSYPPQGVPPPGYPPSSYPPAGYPPSSYPPGPDYQPEQPPGSPYSASSYKGAPPAQPPTAQESQPQSYAARQMIWVRAQDADERERLQESLRAAGIPSFNVRLEGDAVSVSWHNTSEGPAAETLAATLEGQGFKVAAIGQRD
jgi:hypothetical protein